MGQSEGSTERGQIAFEFLIVYSFVLIVFITIFLLIASQRAATVNAQQYSTLQLISQTVAGYIDQAVYEGNGYNATIPLPGSIGVNPYNVTVSSTGVVIASVKVGSQITTAYAFSSARNLVLNGTLSAQSTNVVSLFVVPTKTGYLKIGNLNGVVFVGRVPTGTGGLLKYLSLSILSKGRAQTFNGGNQQNLMPNNIIGKNSVCSATIMAWSQDANMPGTRGMGGVVALNPLPGGSNSLSIEYSDNAIRWSGQLGTTVATAVYSAGNTLRGGWIMTALTLSGGTITGYLNNVSQGTASGLGCDSFGTGQIGNWDKFFNGSIADVRVYNISLSTGDISTTYNSGVDSAPVESANLVGWFKLNGDTNDYSGNNNHALPTNGIAYQTFAQVRATALTSNGIAPTSFPGVGSSQGSQVTSALVGFVNNANVLMSTYGNYNATQLACNGTQTVTLSSNKISGSIQLQAVGFNGNATYLNSCGTTLNKLVAWYPLIENGGGLAHDLGGNYLTAQISGVLGNYPTLGTASNQTFASFTTANFPGDLNGGAGGNQNAWINMSRSNSYNAIVGNRSFTAVAWINMRGPSQVHAQGIFGNFNNRGTTTPSGFQIYANSSATAGCVMTVNSVPVNWPSGNPGNFPIKSWIMITGEYSNLTGQAQVWMNGTLFASNTIGTGLKISQASNLIIGSGAAGAGGIDGFNGFISNVQLYGSYLNQTQINYLYKQGVAGAPLTTAGVVGWWPLDGDYKDYSANGNNGIPINVVMTSTLYNNFTSGTKYNAAVFNPFSKNTIQLIGSVPLLGGNTVTVAAWFNPSPYQGGADRNGIFTFGIPGGTGSMISAEIRNNGVQELATGSDDFTPTQGVHANFNTWNFGAWLLNGNSVSEFMNGQWTNGTLASIPNIQAGNIIIGSSDANIPSSRVFNGYISDVQVYNTVLPITEVWQLYEQGLPKIATMNISSTG